MELKFSPSIGDCFNALLGATSTLKTKEGFLVQSVPNSRSPRSTGFEKVVRSFLGNEHLPFADVLSAERIQRVFAKHGNLFALDGIYTTAVMVWSFLGQVLSDGKQASCQTAVARIVSYCLLTSRNAPIRADPGEAWLTPTKSDPTPVAWKRRGTSRDVSRRAMAGKRGTSGPSNADRSELVSGAGGQRGGFALGCSPPFLLKTQLPSATGR